MPQTLSSPKSTSESVSRPREIIRAGAPAAEALRRQWQARVRAARNAAHPSKRLLPDAVRALPAATAAEGGRHDGDRTHCEHLPRAVAVEAMAYVRNRVVQLVIE